MRTLSASRAGLSLCDQPSRLPPRLLRLVARTWRFASFGLLVKTTSTKTRSPLSRLGALLNAASVVCWALAIRRCRSCGETSELGVTWTRTDNTETYSPDGNR